MCIVFFFFNDTATTEIYTYGHTLSLHDALPIFLHAQFGVTIPGALPAAGVRLVDRLAPNELAADAFDLPVDFDDLKLAHRRSEEHTSELQSLMRISYAVFCLKKTKTKYI